MKYINCIFRDYSNIFRCHRFFLKLTKGKETKKQKGTPDEVPFYFI